MKFSYLFVKVFRFAKEKLIWVISLLFLAISLSAQPPTVTLQQLHAAKKSRIASGTILSGKLHLLLAHHQRKQGQEITAQVAPAEMNLQFHPDEFIQNQHQEILLRLFATQPQRLLASLETLGFRLTGIATEQRLIEGFLSLEKVQKLEDLAPKGLRSVRPVFRPVPQSGVVGTQGDTVLQSYRTRGIGPASFNGSGVSVGVISDSYNLTGGAAAGISNGELPATLSLLQDDSTSTGNDEGRAMLEIIHDLAPGSPLFFHTGSSGELAFANGIQALTTAGCDIIVDDMVYREEPFFQDGIVAQQVNQVVNQQDVMYFSAAGNLANHAYEIQNPTFSNDSAFGVFSLDFDSGASFDHYQQIILNDGEVFRPTLQWDDPWYANLVDTDMDIYVTDEPITTILTGSNDFNFTTQEPSETFTYTDNTTDGLPDTINVYMVFFGGATPNRIKYINFGSHDIAEFETFSSTIVPHAAADSCIAIAAAPYWVRTPEGFTSHGPSTYLFDQNGVPLANPLVRAKPDFTAPDATNNSFFGADLLADADAFPNFQGTSAAAAHAAGVAALMRQAYPTLDRTSLYNIMLLQTQDIGLPGYDSISGYGLISGYLPIYSTPVPVFPIYSEGMENGFLAQEWEITSTGGGRIVENTFHSPFSGLRHLIMDTWIGGTPSLNEAILHFDAGGYGNLTLSFDQKESNDPDHPMPATFSGSINADGVALSIDGINWFRLFDLTGATSQNNYTNQSINISNFATTNGFSLGNHVRIKFQQFGQGTFPAGGQAFDNIEVAGIVLPVDLLAFEATSVNQQAHLQWSVAPSSNAKHYAVERAPDGQSFSPIWETAHLATQLTYDFQDVHPLPGTNYYRLRIKDLQGTVSYSDIRALTFTAQATVTIAPNPIEQSQLRFQLHAKESGLYRATILNALGQSVIQQQYQLTAGYHPLTLPSETLPAGTYWIVLQTNAGTVALVPFFK